MDGTAPKKDVRWLAAVRADDDMVVINASSPLQNLQDLVDALKQDPMSLSVGAGEGVGSQTTEEMRRTSKELKSFNKPSEQSTPAVAIDSRRDFFLDGHVLGAVCPVADIDHPCAYADGCVGGKVDDGGHAITQDAHIDKAVHRMI